MVTQRNVVRVLLILPLGHVYAQEPSTAFLITGTMTEGSSLVPFDFELPEVVNAERTDVALEIFDVPVELYLRFDSRKDWSFSMSFLANNETFATHTMVVRKDASLIHELEFHVGIERIQIDIEDTSGARLESLELDLDFASETGTWDWLTDICIVCDAIPSPRAHGTIDSIGRAPVFEYDCNFDGNVSFLDLACSNEGAFTELLLQELELLPGDLDGDGVVGFADFLRLSENFGEGSIDQGQSPVSYLTGDIDGDDEVGFLDFLILSSRFNEISNPQVAAPEPAHFNAFILSVLVCLRSAFAKHRGCEKQLPIAVRKRSPINTSEVQSTDVERAADRIAAD